MHTSTPQPPWEANSIAATNLARLLSRLDEKLDSSDSAPRTSLEQTKLASNLEYARQLLHKLESSTSLITVPTKKQKALADLGAQKQRIRRLNESLHAAASRIVDDGALSDDPSGGSSSGLSDGDEGSDGDAEYDDDYARLNRPRKQKPVAEQPAPATSASIPQPPPQPTSTVRNRFPTKSEDEKKKATLFGKAAQQTGENAGTEHLLDNQRQQQEDITSDLLSMAKMLKESSLDFSKNLEDEKGYLDLAKEGLDRNAMGMDATGRRLDLMRKNDSVSYMRGLIYLASIVGLAFLVLFVLFFAPKLRWW